MTPGSIVLVDWRDALHAAEPNKRRPGVVVSAGRFFGHGVPFEIVVPLTSEPQLAIEGASVAIDPTDENGCAKRCYALSWNVQTVSSSRITATASQIDPRQLRAIRAQIAACVDAPDDAISAG